MISQRLLPFLAFLLGAFTVYVVMREATAPPSGPSPQPLVLQQDSHRAVVNFDSLTVASHEALHFQAPSPESTMLIRVRSDKPVQIEGTLRSDHPLHIVAPGGINIGPGAQIQLPPAPESEGAKCLLPPTPPN